MSIISGICAGEVRPAIASMKNEIAQLDRDKTKYCSGYEETISKLKLVLCSGNRFAFSAERLALKEKELAEEEMALLREKTPLQEKIAALQANILTLKGFPAQTINQMENFTQPVIQIMESYLEEL